VAITEEYYRTRLARAQERLEEARTRAEAARADCQKFYQQVEDLHARRLESLTDHQLLETEEMRLWFCALTGMVPHRKKEQLQGRGLPAGLMLDGVDGRDEYLRQQLPCLTLALRQEQPAGEIVDAMRRWANIWRLGRSDMPVRILEAGLSRWQSYSAMWDLDSDELIVKGSYRGVMFQGPLEEGVIFVAKHLPLYDKGGESLCGDD